jgi:formylglycine-generating enzyme required for sulfatase activity
MASLGLSPQQNNTDFDIKETQKTLVKINDALYASKYEVTNKQYVAYLNFLKQNNYADKLVIAQIDTARWSNGRSFNEPYVIYYHTHPAYQDYPVVNITYEGAKLYCKWLTGMYNSNPKRKFNKVKFRLPSAEEWIIAAKGKEDNTVYPWCGTKLVNKKGQHLCNYRQPGVHMGISGKVSDNADITAPVESYWPNDYGLYNMSGNAAEMVSAKGISKGGSWADPAEHMAYDHVGTYEESAQPTIGFRYFMDIMEK